MIRNVLLLFLFAPNVCGQFLGNLNFKKFGGCRVTCCKKIVQRPTWLFEGKGLNLIIFTLKCPEICLDTYGHKYINT